MHMLTFKKVFNLLYSWRVRNIKVLQRYMCNN